MERQDTDMEARGPSNVNIVDAAASHPRCSLRSTDSINKGESSAPGYTHTIAPYFLQQQTKQRQDIAAPFYSGDPARSRR